MMADESVAPEGIDIEIGFHIARVYATVDGHSVKVGVCMSDDSPVPLLEENVGGDTWVERDWPEIAEKVLSSAS